MTAAHCIFGESANDINVLLGEHDYAIEEEAVTLRLPVAEIIQDELYDSGTENYDFALLKLASPIDFSAHPHIRPACLPENSANNYTDFSAIVSGWGRIEYGGETSTYLKYVEVNVLSNAQCRSSDYGYDEDKITDQMICANVAGGGKDSCQGDSGGPLVTKNPDLYELIGVVSWGVGCAWADYPGVYAKMTERLDWVYEKTAGSWNTCGRCTGSDCPAPGGSGSGTG